MQLTQVYIVAAGRTPFAKVGTELKDVEAPYLGTGLIRHLLDEKQLLDDQCVDEVIVGNVGSPAQFSNLARVMAVNAGLSEKTCALTVNRNCGSGMEAVAMAADRITSGKAQMVFAGGVESMSQIPFVITNELSDFFQALIKAKSLRERITLITTLNVKKLLPNHGIKQGLYDPLARMTMMKTVEHLARELAIRRDEMDMYAHYSHLKAVKAQKENLFDRELIPVLCSPLMDRLLGRDIGPRADSNLEALAKLEGDLLTAGNSSPLSDGGAMLLLANEEMIKKYELKPLVRIVNYQVVGLAAKYMAMGPLLATSALLQKEQLKLSDIDIVEMTEAFAGQVLANLQAFKNEKTAALFGLSHIDHLGALPDEKLNPQGGSLALGHPVAASGARLLVTIAHQMQVKNLKRGLATLCIGGGQGAAMLLERV